MTEDDQNPSVPRILPSHIYAAYQRIVEHILPTRLVEDPSNHLWLKCEQEQVTGSFKVRGALSRLSGFLPGQAIITASTGNHGLGIAKAAEIFKLQAKIFIPLNASPKKIEQLVNLGVDLEFVRGDSLDAETAGKEYAQIHHLPWVSPYNDPDVIAGQGTIGLELTKSLTHIHKIYVTVGGGGLISGIASWVKHHLPHTEIIGCQPVNSPEMYLSIQAGHVVDAPESKPTLSDGSAGPLEKDSITFPLCRQLIDRFILMDEQEIEEAILYLYSAHKMVVEGAAGVAMAAALKDTSRTPEDISVVVLCGGNIDPKIHQQICAY